MNAVCSYITDMGIFGSKTKMTLTVEGMTCEHCEQKVRSALSGVEGVKKVLKVDRTANEAVISVKSPVAAGILAQAVADAGFTAKQ
jgi:copper chaperone